MKKIICILLLCGGVFFCLSAQEGTAQGNPIDLVVVLDTSAGMSGSYRDFRDYLIGPFLSEFLRIGDTFHLISFSDKARIEIARRIEGIGDVETVIGRIFLMYPLEPSSDLTAALRYTENYVSLLPGTRSKKVLLFSGGEALAGNSGQTAAGVQGLITETASRFSRFGAEFRYVPVPLTGRLSSGRPPMPVIRAPPVSSTPPSAAVPARENAPGPVPVSPRQPPVAATPQVAVAPPVSSTPPSVAAPVRENVQRPEPASPRQPPSAVPPVTVAPSVPSTPPPAAAPVRENAPRPDSASPPRQPPVAVAPPVSSTPPSAAAPARENAPGPVPVSPRQPPTTATPPVAVVPPVSSMPPSAAVPARENAPRPEPASPRQPTASATPPVSSTPPAAAPARENAPRPEPASPRQPPAAATPPVSQADLPSPSSRVTENPLSTDRMSADVLSTDTAEERSAGNRPAGINNLPLPLLIGLLALAALLLGLVIFLVTGRLHRSPNRAIAHAALPRRKGEEKPKAPVEDKREELLANYAATQRRRTTITPRDIAPGKTSSEKPPEEPYSEALTLSLFVEDQNTAIGRRNIHTLKPGYTLTIGGGKSDFLIFLVPIPPHIAEIRFDGRQCTFIPRKSWFFPEINSQPVPNCIGKTIRIVSAKNYDLHIRLERYEDPLIALNRLLRSVNVPG